MSEYRDRAREAVERLAWQSWPDETRVSPQYTAALDRLLVLVEAETRVEKHLKNGDTECWQLTKWPQHDPGEDCERCAQFADLIFAQDAIDEAGG